MFTTVASSTTMNWAMQAITSTSHLLAAARGGRSTTVAVGVRTSLIGAPETVSAAKLDLSVRLRYHKRTVRSAYLWSTSLKTAAGPGLIGARDRAKARGDPLASPGFGTNRRETDSADRRAEQKGIEYV